MNIYYIITLFRLRIVYIKSKVAMKSPKYKDVTEFRTNSLFRKRRRCIRRPIYFPFTSFQTIE